MKASFGLGQRARRDVPSARKGHLSFPLGVTARRSEWQGTQGPGRPHRHQDRASQGSDSGTRSHRWSLSAEGGGQGFRQRHPLGGRPGRLGQPGPPPGAPEEGDGVP